MTQSFFLESSSITITRTSTIESTTRTTATLPLLPTDTTATALHTFPESTTHTTMTSESTAVTVSSVETSNQSTDELETVESSPAQIDWRTTSVTQADDNSRTEISDCSTVNYLETPGALERVSSNDLLSGSIADLVSTGVELRSKGIIRVNFGKHGVILRDVRLMSTDMINVVLTGTPVAGSNVFSMVGPSESFASLGFPNERIGDLTIIAMRVDNGTSIRNLTLSIIVCADFAVSANSETITEPSIVSIDGAEPASEFCEVIEMIPALILSDSTLLNELTATDSNSLMDDGLNCTIKDSHITVPIPNHKAIVRDIQVHSDNIVKLEVVFYLVSGFVTAPFTGSPTDLPKEQFPQEAVNYFTMNVLETSDDQPPRNVKLSITVCSDRSSCPEDVSGQFSLQCHFAFVDTSLNFFVREHFDLFEHCGG